MATHAVIGTGTAPSKVIMDGLAEAVDDGDTLSLVWTGAPEEGSAIESVYAFVKDSETPTTVYHEDGQNIPQALRSWDNVSVVKTRQPFVSALDSLSDDGVVLFLWNDAKPNEIHDVFDYSETCSVMELSNGLCPIVPGDESPATPPPASEPEPRKSKAPELLSIDELQVMTAIAVKQYGQDMGCESKTKAGIIEEIAARLETEVPSPPEPVAEEPAPVVKVDNVSFPTTKTETTTPDWDEEVVALIKDFLDQRQTGFEADMAHLALGQARLWMLKALNR